MKKVFLCLLAIFTLGCISTPFSYAQEAPSNSSETIATLLPGEEFNAKIKSITKGDNIPRYNASTTYDNLIKSIKKSKNKKEGLTNENLISKAGSIEIRAWYDNTNNLGILYYYTNADKIFLNENSRNMFSSMKELTDISVLSGWDTSNVTNMVAMFSNCNKLTDITALSNWDTNNVKDMSSMFRDCKSLADITALSGRNTSNVESIGGMFLGCESLIEIDLSNWDTKNVTNMREMFSSCGNLTKVNLNNWDTSNVEDMTKMFRDCNKLTDISTLSGWNTSNVKDMYQMFLGCESLADITALSGWNTSNVKNMNYMFGGCDSLTEINLSNWDLSNAQDVDYMFAECENLAKIDLRNWDLSNIKSIKRMFRDCSKLTDISTLSGWDTSNIENMWGLFDGCESLTDISALSGWNTSKVEDIGNMFEGCSSLTDISALSNWNTSNVTGMTEIFRWCSSLTGISPLSNWDTSNVTSMYEMFEGCSSLTDISALSNWNTSNVTSMEEIFRGCSSLTGISPLSNWNTSNVTDMSYMFYGCNSLTDISALSSWDTSNIESIGDMFDGCSSLTGIDLTNWDTSNVTNMGGMFNGCNNLEKIYVSNKFTIKNVTYSNFMFHGCTKLVGGNGTKYNDQHRDAEYARIDTAETPGYFTAITNEATNGCIGMDQANVTATATQGVITLKWNAISGDTVQISLFDPNDEVFKNLGSVNMASGEFDYTMQWNGVHNFVLNNGCSDFHYQFNVSMSELYPDDFINAYNWAYENGLTTEPNIEEANMYGVLTNLELADIMGKYAENVLNQTPDSNKSCTFDDISTLTQEEQNIIKKACQLGLMPGDKTRTSFNPNDTGNRATFGTALSRALWGNQFDGGTPYYANHLNALKAAGIMNKIDKPENTIEIKGYILVTLMRATTNEIDCNDATIMLVCQDPESDIYENCPRICRKNNEIDCSDADIMLVCQNSDPDVYKNCPKICRKNNSTENTNSGNNTHTATTPKSYGYSGGGGRSSSTKISSKNTNTKTENNKKTSTENGRTTTTPTNAKGNTNITTNKKQPIDYMVPTINKVKHNEGNSSEVLENGFTRERNNAYGFAYANGITTIKNIEKANLNGAITRAAMAKMLSNYAINVLGKEPDTSKAPHFGDISKETDKQYDNGITLAYQLGIMGVGTKNFRPYDPVTRKEFVTVLSRMLYNTTDGASKTNYYEPHMAKLYDEGIITKTNPATIEKRGNVMTMLMRSAK